MLTRRRLEIIDQQHMDITDSNSFLVEIVSHLAGNHGSGLSSRRSSEGVGCGAGGIDTGGGGKTFMDVGVGCVGVCASICPSTLVHRYLGILLPSMRDAGTQADDLRGLGFRAVGVLLMLASGFAERFALAVRGLDGSSNRRIVG